MTDKLNAGDQFPSVSLLVGEGDTMQIPDDLQTPYAVVLFYRGHW